MTLWIDAQLSPHLAVWLQEQLSLEACSARRLGLRDAEDVEIFEAASKAEAVVITKDRDFVDLLEQRGSPPKVIWVTCGNTSNRHLKAILKTALPEALQLLADSEDLVEISDAQDESVPVQE